MAEKQPVIVKILKWETLQVLPEDEKSVKEFMEKLESHKDEALDNQHKLMYAGQTLVDDKSVFFCRPQPITVLMVTDKKKPEKHGLLMYVEWPVKKGQRHVKMLRMIEKVPPKAESENEKQPLEVEPEKEKETSTTKPEKETALPQADSKIEKDLPQADSLMEQKSPETESEEKEETPKYEAENVPSEIGEAENVPSDTELTAEKLSPKPEGKGKAGAQMRKPAPKAVVIGNPLPKTEPGSNGKPKVQNTFDFVGEFVGFGSGEELLCVQKEGRDPTALSEDLLVEAIKKKLLPIAKLIKSIMRITPLQSKL